MSKFEMSEFLPFLQKAFERHFRNIANRPLAGTHLQTKINLGSTVGSLLHTESNKDGVGHFDQDVIDAVHMDELDPPPLQVVHDTLIPEGSVKTTIAI